MDNKVTKRLSNDKRYERPEKTYQDNLSNQDIKDKLKDYKSKLQTKPNEIRNYDFYQKVLDWAKEELAGKTIKELLRTIIKEKIVVIKNSDSKETKNEGDKLVAGNIVYSGQNFNNLNKENISRFINKEGYKESYSGKAMYVTNNIPYAFYYCHLRFALEGKSVSDTLFPTIYKITLKPGTEFFYKGDTNIDKEESKSALICGVSGFHSGNDIVNNQSVEISLFNSDCIENIEAIKPNELITYLDSPQLKLDDNIDHKFTDKELRDMDIRKYRDIIIKIQGLYYKSNWEWNKDDRNYKEIGFLKTRGILPRIRDVCTNECRTLQHTSHKTSQLWFLPGGTVGRLLDYVFVMYKDMNTDENGVDYKEFYNEIQTSINEITVYLDSTTVKVVDSITVVGDKITNIMAYKGF